jgi:hypothetical protein
MGTFGRRLAINPIGVVGGGDAFSQSPFNRLVKPTDICNRTFIPAARLPAHKVFVNSMPQPDFRIFRSYQISGTDVLGAFTKRAFSLAKMPSGG